MSAFNLTPESPSQPQIELMAKSERLGELIRSSSRAHESAAAMGVYISVEPAAVEAVAPITPVTDVESAPTNPGEVTFDQPLSEIEAKRAMVSTAIAQQPLPIEREFFRAA